jgi:hypothetical protein
MKDIAAPPRRTKVRRILPVLVGFIEDLALVNK